MAVLATTFHLDLDTTEVDGKRHYVTPEGNLYPSVTTVLSRFKEKDLQKWVDRVGVEKAERIRDEAATFGTAVHELCEAYVKGIPFPKSDMFQMERFESIKPIIDKRVGNVFACETALYSDKLKLAGRSDLFGDFDGIPSVIDYKNASKPKKLEYCDSYFMQGAGYGYMWYERTKDRLTTPQQIVIIISQPYDDPQVFIEPIQKWIPTMKNVVEVYS